MAYAERCRDQSDMWLEDERRSVLFEGLLKRLSPTLKRIARKLNGYSSFMDDQDLYQEALVHLWMKFSARDLDDKTDSYVLQGCYFHLKNHIRKTQDSPTIIRLSDPAGEDGISIGEVLPSEGVSSYDEAEGRLQIEAIAASGISEREKTVLLYCLEDMTTREIGQRLGISHVSVVKIRNKIRDRYEKIVGQGKTPAQRELKCCGAQA